MNLLPNIMAHKTSSKLPYYFVCLVLTITSAVPRIFHFIKLVSIPVFNRCRHLLQYTFSNAVYQSHIALLSHPTSLPQHITRISGTLGLIMATGTRAPPKFKGLPLT